MATVTAHLVNAFTEENGSGGNPAGVVLDAESLSFDDRQKIAARIGLSETAFVSLIQSGFPKLDFFTPTRPIPHCGHATLAVFSLLAEQKKLDLKREVRHETPDGKKRIRFSSGSVFMEMNLPVRENIEAGLVPDLWESLGTTTSHLSEKLPIQIASSGNRFLIVPVDSGNDLRLLKPDFARIREISETLNLVGYYVFTFEAQGKSRQASSRMFAPRFGIEEEAATGTAAGPLACYLYGAADMKQTRFVLEQGSLMPKPRPSEIAVELECEKGAIKILWVGGRASLFEVKREVI